jgi:pyruvate kinase
METPILKRTKIICTIGPASENRETLTALMNAGMNAARLNFSHGTHDEQKDKIDLIKSVREELSLPIPIILDTKGPEIRTGKFENGGIILEEGQKFFIYTDDRIGNQESCSASYEGMLSDVKIGDKVLIDDGLIQLTVTDISGDRLTTVADNGGEIKDNKGINLPGVHINLPAITDKDKKDILFGISQGIDFVAASFTRSSGDVLFLRYFLDENDGKNVKIISKIENREGVDNIASIISESDGIMVARGDLGVEIPPEEVPLIQKDIISKCNRAGKFVITATQMLDSMIHNPRPTRAEVADVANAILDGTDVVMLSGETASGNYPVEAVEMMTNVALSAEEGIDYDGKIRQFRKTLDRTVTNVTCFAACSSAEAIKASAIIVPTLKGYSAAIMSGFRPKSPIIAFSPNKEVVRQLALFWGLFPHYIEYMNDAERFFNSVIRKTRREGKIQDGDYIVLSAGLPLGQSAHTNMVRIHQVGVEYE